MTDFESEMHDQDQTALRRALFALKDMRSRLEAAERAKTEPIAVVGMACRIPGGANDPEGFWELLHEGVDAVRTIPPDRWDVDAFYDPDPDMPGKMISRRGGFIEGIDQFDPQFFGISPREAVTLDPQQRLLLEASWEALEHAGYSPARLVGSQTGVYVGISSFEYSQFNMRMDNMENIDPYVGTGGMFSVAAGRVAYVLGLHGPTVAVDTACSSSLVTVHMAVQSLRTGHCDMALAGGVNLILSPLANIYLSRMKALSPDGWCRTFAASANGFVRGEGCGMVVLKRLSDALADGDNIMAVIRGSAINHDGRSSGLTVPNGLAQQDVIRLALADAGGLTPEQISYVEAHGTGTPLGDPIEVRALAEVLCQNRPADHPLMLGSVKTNIGHLESAAGIAAFMKAVLALQHKEIPPHLHLDALNPHVDWENLPIVIPTTPTPWETDGEARRAGISAFGFSGTNAHIIVEESPAVPEAVPVEDERPVHVVSLSARTETALKQLAERYEHFVAEHGAQVALPDIGYTANTARAPFAYRAVVVARSAEQLRHKLSVLMKGETEAGIRSGWTDTDIQPKVAFLFTGQGSQYPDMGRQLYETQPVFRQALDQCAELLQSELEQPLLSVLYSDEHEGLLNETQYTQPALFALEYALAMLWQSWGIVPAAVMGHSVGEYVAAVLAGVFSLEDGLKLIAARGRLMGALPAGGQMAAIFADEQRVKAALADYEDRVSIAAVNAPGQIVISGAGDAVQALADQFTADGIKARPLVVSHAFHSPLMEPMLDEFERIASQVQYAAPKLRLISNVTGQVAGPEIATPQYWRQHVREAVQFMRAVETLGELRHDVFLEVGPGTTLLGLGQQCLPGDQYAWLPSLRKGRDDWDQIAEALGGMFVQGVEVDWDAFDRGYPRRRIPMPTYPFQREYYWTEAAAEALRPRQARRTAGVLADSVHPLLGQRLRSASKDIQFEAEISISSLPFLNDHQVFETVVFPGTGYMEMGLAAAREVFGAGTYSIENLSIQDPLILADDETRVIQLILTVDRPGRGMFQVFSLVDEKSDQPAWKLHAEGTVQAARADMAESIPHLEAVQAHFEKEVPVEGYYESLQEIGLQYGPAFQGLQQMWREGTEALGYIEAALPPAHVSEFQLHPALLDSCLHPLDAVFEGDRDYIYLPMGLKRLTAYHTAGEVIWSHVTVHVTSENGRPGESFTADLHIYDESARLVAEIESLYLKRAPRESLRRAMEKQAEEWLYEIDWQPRPLAEAAGEGAGQWLILADRGGFGEQLAAVLAEQGQNCDVIFAGDESAPDGQFIPPMQPEAFEHLLQDHAYTGVVHLWSLDADVTDLEAAQPLGTASVLHLAQALAKSGSAGNVRLWLVTAEAQAGNVAQAPVWGLGRVIAGEYPQLWGGLIDLQGAGDHLKLLAQHLLADDGEGQVVLRDGERYAARLARHGDTQGALKLQPGQPFELDITERGILENLILRPVTRQVPAAGQVEVQVRATGLNFRDVLNALGMYPGNAGSLGTECAGTVVSVGEGVTEFAVGDDVIVLANGTFRSHVVAPVDMVFLSPANLSLAEAVTLPTTFLTAYYGLHRLANMKAGDRVLIHAAAGGVGLAAVQLALRAGAEIFGTAGSPEKREFLKSLGVHHILNSRTLDFADEIMALTEGQGVNIVLNSLAGEFIPKSLSVLADNGCFLEIGKQGVWTNEQVAELNPTLSSYVYDLAQILYDEPGVIQADLLYLLEEAEAGHIEALPIKTFPMEEVIEAFRFMAQARHIGKVVITQEAGSATIRDDGSYLVTGGLGGLGLKVAQWLVDSGARHLVLMSRRPPSDTAQAALAAIEQAGAQVMVAQGDVSKAEDVSYILDSVAQSMPPLRGIIHAAGVLDDGMLPQQNWSRFERVMQPKMWGAWNLHVLTEGLPLDFFVMFSSVASVLGSPGQGNYAAGNAFLDALAAYRRAHGLPGLSINWGAWSEVGMAASMDSRQQDRLAAQGMNAISPALGLSALEQVIWERQAQVVAMLVNWPKLLRQFDQVPPLFEAFAQPVAEQEAPAAESELLAKLRAATPEARYEVLVEFVREQVVRVLGLDPTTAPGLRQGLIEIGMDSLMAVELSNRFRAHFHQSFPTTLAFEHSTIQALATYLAENLQIQFDEQANGAAPQSDPGASGHETMETAQLLSNLDHLSDDEIDALLRQMQVDQEK